MLRVRSGTCSLFARMRTSHMLTRNCPNQGRDRLLHNSQQIPPLRLGHWTALDDLNEVSHVRFVVLIVNVANRSGTDRFAIFRMLERPADFDPARFRILISCYPTNQCSLHRSDSAIRVEFEQSSGFLLPIWLTVFFSLELFASGGSRALGLDRPNPSNFPP